ncbi:hypothetical protein BaRGS_00025644, partial [Batillaria attramentaria]
MNECLKILANMLLTLRNRGWNRSTNHSSAELAGHHPGKQAETSITPDSTVTTDAEAVVYNTRENDDDNASADHCVLSVIALKPWAVSSACPFWMFEAHPERKMEAECCFDFFDGSWQKQCGVRLAPCLLERTAGG